MDLFNKGHVDELERQIEDLKQQVQALSQYGGMTAVQVQQEISSLNQNKANLEASLADLSEKIKVARLELVETQEIAMLQEVGIYEFSEILDTAVAYQDKIKVIEDKVKAANKPGGGATSSAIGWTVNGSAKEGAHMINETSKLMLRAYNAEVEDALRTLKPFKVPAAIDRLNKVRESITKLGKTMKIEIDNSYHQLRISEIKLTGDFLEKQAREKEEQKAIAQALKDEAKAQAEFEAEKAKHLKELAQHETILKAAEKKGDQRAIEESQAKISEIQEAIKGVEERAANIKQGFVYVISNIGSFGEEVIKIGLTRRINYEDRIHELSDASVPFIFDIHAVIASEDAVALERKLHDALDEYRLNKVNAKKEFFRATPKMVKEKLEEIAGEHLLVFNEEAEASEYRISSGQNIKA
jgi:Domain of unknown function (DUF4041)/T5orf172 domain